MAMTRIISLSIESRPECIELLSRALHGLCSLLRLPAEELAKVELAMVEAVNNVVEHAYGFEPAHRVWVEFELTPERFGLRVSDRGQAMPPERLASARGFADPDPADPDTWTLRTRGLEIIKACMDEVEYQVRDGVNTLSMSRTLAGAAARQSA
ncbi:MAG: ATP-binding protein [Candidatus Competibacter sp.]|nr:ATP-binding protein [Candidatus Competibacter sp.]MDG4583301.1 ATP-binding protein [Candidatus Competibacter sp.]